MVYMESLTKKLFAVAVVLFTLTACGGDDDTPEQPIPEYEYNARRALNGKFHGERQSTLGDITEYEDIEFQPYDKPKEANGFYGKFTAYGIAFTCDYVNDNAPFATYRNYYSLDTSRGEPFTLSFYRCNDNGDVINREDRRIIEFQTLDLFFMRPYGTTAENNKTYRRQ